jgi:3-oxoacyl-[acyl-carrier-protein] synthase II
MRNKRRVVITGLGIVAPNGIGKDAFWENLIAGHSAVDWITSFDPSPYPCKVAAQVKDFNPRDFVGSRAAKNWSRCTQMGIAASHLAVADANAGRHLGRMGERAGVCFGTSANGTGDIGEDNHRSFLAKGAIELNPLAMLEYPAHAATSHIAKEFSIPGPSTTIASGCATGLDTVRWGMSEIGAGNLDLAIVGASDAPVTEFIFSLFSAGKFLATWADSPKHASRPYDLLRSGLVLGEAAAALILEDLDHAMSRGSRIYAELIGTGNSSEGGFEGRIREVYARGLEAAIVAAFRSAELVPEELDYISSHGNSTKNDDAAETAAFKSALGSHAYKIPISSIKGALGQPLAAGGVLQLAASALAIETQQVPPTANYEVPDPECDLDYVPGGGRVARVRTALVHSHSLGGLVPGSHTAVLIRAPA